MFDKVKNVFYRPDFFRRQEFTLGQALQFYSVSILVLVLGFSLTLIPVAWGINHFFQSARWEDQKNIVKHLYPQGLIITLESGKLRTNQADPVVIPFPDQWRESGTCKKEGCTTETWPANFLVIDREVDVSRKSLLAYDTLILASETEIGFSQPKRGETRSFSLTQMKLDKPVQITHDLFESWADPVGRMIYRAILVLTLIAPFFMYVGLWIGYLFYTLLGSLIVWLATHIRHYRLTYARAFASTLYLLPASFLISFLLSVFSVRIPFLFTLVLCIMALVNFEKQLGNDTTPLPSPISPPTTPPRPTETTQSPL